MRLTVITVLALLTPLAFSMEPPHLSEYLDREVTEMEATFEASDTEVTEGVEQASEMWLFRRFFFRARPYVTLTAGVAKISIIPDIEIVWDRKSPEGWVPYKP